MNPKEKAQKLAYKFRQCSNGYYFSKKNIRNGIQSAIIAVDEILEATKTEYQIRYDNGEYSREIGYHYSDYWQQVRKELEANVGNVTIIAAVAY